MSGLDPSRLGPIEINHWKAWIPAPAIGAVSSAAYKMTPIAQGVLSQLPTSVNNGIKDTFKKLMVHTGLWETECFRVKTISDYIQTILLQNQNPPIKGGVIPLTDVPLTLREKRGAIISQLLVAGMPDEDIERYADWLLHCYEDSIAHITQKTVKKYQNSFLNLSIIPDLRTFPPDCQVVWDRERAVVKLKIEQKFNIQSSDALLSDGGGYVQLGWVHANSEITCALANPVSVDYEVVFLPEWHFNPGLLLEDYIAAIDLPASDVPVPYTIKGTDVEILLPHQFVTDHDRQINIIAGRPFLFDKSFDVVDAIYDFTEKNKELTEKICGILTQRTFFESANLMIEKFSENNIAVTQLQEYLVNFNLFKDPWGAKLTCAVVFARTDLESAEHKSFIKAITTIDFETGRGTIRYEEAPV